MRVPIREIIIVKILVTTYCENILYKSVWWFYLKVWLFIRIDTMQLLGGTMTKYYKQKQFICNQWSNQIRVDRPSPIFIHNYHVKVKYLVQLKAYTFGSYSIYVKPPI